MRLPIKELITMALLLTFSSSSFAKENVIYKYKQYEKFDLGNLEIKGEIIAPGDLSVRERNRKVFEANIFEREDYDKEIIKEIKFIR